MGRQGRQGREGSRVGVCGLGDCKDGSAWGSGLWLDGRAGWPLRVRAQKRCVHTKQTHALRSLVRSNTPDGAAEAVGAVLPEHGLVHPQHSGDAPGDGAALCAAHVYIRIDPLMLRNARTMYRRIEMRKAQRVMARQVWGWAEMDQSKTCALWAAHAMLGNVMWYVAYPAADHDAQWHTPQAHSPSYHHMCIASEHRTHLLRRVACERDNIRGDG